MSPADEAKLKVQVDSTTVQWDVVELSSFPFRPDASNYLEEIDYVRSRWPRHSMAQWNTSRPRGRPLITNGTKGSLARLTGSFRRAPKTGLRPCGLQPTSPPPRRKLVFYGPLNRAAFNHIEPKIASQLPTAPENIDKQFFRDLAYWEAQSPSGKTNLEVLVERWIQWVAS
ncbi:MULTISPECIES: hypothetical protein [unclassified Mesorhizobium]|uniref:hypothetical protein n=1 Tax=unclassified Mesorhizobium TaxID=325217 RepID=UPI000FD57417|nr:MULTISPECIES: hypothetical protein [unclassified Mesorhizobium]RVB71413.1 hypothetical protein EN885_32380 [Mesorhizobium sp. M6A.T.Cr.TU.014.01.1.1]RWP94989.1 MAG: hypothetical protein EOR90_32405 [Mesorhizobium sp.]RWP95278.1 MAG: hypothetical protein EOR91_32650 [Mesorhizobium sp.]